MPESPSVMQGAGVAERQTQNTRNVRGASPCGFESHHPHTGLTIYASRAYTRITLRVFCVMIPSRKKAAELSAAFAFTGAQSAPPMDDRQRDVAKLAEVG